MQKVLLPLPLVAVLALRRVLQVGHLVRLAVKTGLVKTRASVRSGRQPSGLLPLVPLQTAMMGALALTLTIQMATGAETLPHPALLEALHLQLPRPQWLLLPAKLAPPPPPPLALLLLPLPSALGQTATAEAEGKAAKAAQEKAAMRPVPTTPPLTMTMRMTTTARRSTRKRS